MYGAAYASALIAGEVADGGFRKALGFKKLGKCSGGAGVGSYYEACGIPDGQLL